MSDISENSQRVPSGIKNSSLEDYKISLLVVVPPAFSEKERAIVDERFYIESLSEAKEKQEQIKRRRHSEKRRIIIVSIVQETKNFSDFK